MWHLIGITDTEPATPFSEFHLAHATAASLHGPWTKQPYVLSADRSAGEEILWAPHVIRHDGLYWMFVCAGGEPRPSSGSTSRRRRTVLRVDDRWIMYYTATKDGAGVVSRARATTLLRPPSPTICSGGVGATWSTSMR